MLPKHVHLIGIGGAGMAALSQYLLASGRTVSGSDQTHNSTINELRAAGARISLSHDDAQLEGVELVVVSDAIPTGNVEFEGARVRGIPVLRRSECLNLLPEGRRAIMVAGSHGKSTTSAMIAKILDEAEQDPSFVLGADVPSLGGRRAHFSDGDIFVAEACEAFRNLDALSASIAVITNVDDEHVNHYASQRALDGAFSAFAKRASTIIASGDDVGVARLNLTGRELVTFGLDPRCTVSAEPWPAAFVPNINGLLLPSIDLHQPGEHMRRNALAAVATCHSLGISPQIIALGLERFTGVDRRWQDLGEVSGIRIIDDYAHHPAELAATLSAVREVAPDRRIIVAFQPLLHSRVQRLQEGFINSLACADQLLILEVDAGGEGQGSTTSAAIVSGLKHRGIAVTYREDTAELIANIHDDLEVGDVLLVVGGMGMANVAQQIHRKLADHAPIESTAHFPHVKRNWKQRLSDAWRRPKTFVSMFRNRSYAHPNAPAIIGKDLVLTYGELDRSSDELAAGLAATGVAGSVIGVALPLGAELIITLLGVMKAGATYLPLDLAVPEARRAYMVTQAGAAAVISHNLTADIPVLTPIALRSIGRTIPDAPNETDGAYICFTSGSTGFPKGIRIRHLQLASLLLGTVKRFEINAATRMLLNTSIGFDVSLAEICGTLAGGGALVVARDKPIASDRLLDVLEELKVSHLSITPSLLATAKFRTLPDLTHIIVAGEACPPELVADWAPGRRLFNAYGPTEASIYATVATCTKGQEVTIGTALDHLEAHVLDDALQPVGIGELGELCLSGVGIAEGYIGRPEEAAERFPQAIVDDRALRLYRTGDLVRRGQDGALHFIGRADAQVKINGVRIELDEIERLVMRQDGVAMAATCLVKSPRPQLHCFVQAIPEASLDVSAISARLAEWLPAGAVPTHIQFVPEIPMTPSGKKDRQKLLAAFGRKTTVQAPEYWPPVSEIEIRLAPLWQEALGLNAPVGRLDRFPSLGGDSLSSLILIQLIEEHFETTVPPGFFGRIGALPQMATQIEELLWHRGSQHSAAEGFRASRIYHRMKDLTVHWPGSRLSPDHLISSLGSEQAQGNIFLCCQMETEFEGLADNLAPAYRVHGMRSGHLIIDNGPGDIFQLASHYAEEISLIAPSGPIILAGVCQGGAIVQTIAEILIAQGRAVPLLVLIEPGRPRPYTGRAALIWAEESFLNPLKLGGAGLASYEAAMLGGFSYDFVPGSHGHACIDPAVKFVAHHFRKHLEAALDYV